MEFPKIESKTEIISMVKKKKSPIEQDGSEYNLGISVGVESKGPDHEDEIDRNGLESGDEFYRLSFSQSSPQETLDVKPATYALMTWWKVRMGNRDTIDISSDSNYSMLRFDSIHTGGGLKGGGLGKKEKVAIDHIIEVNELSMLVSLYSYIAKSVPDDMANELSASLMNLNPKLQYGSVEIYTAVTNDIQSQHFLRYRVSTCLKGVKVGKVNAVENMIDLAQANHGLVLDLICQTPNYKNWLLS